MQASDHSMIRFFFNIVSNFKNLEKNFFNHIYILSSVFRYGLMERLIIFVVVDTAGSCVGDGLEYTDSVVG